MNSAFGESFLINSLIFYMAYNGVVYRKESQVKTDHPWDYLSHITDFGLTDTTHIDYLLC